MTEFLIAMALFVGILRVILIVLIDVYPNHKQSQITYKRKRWTMNAKKIQQSTPSRCLGLDMGLACGCSFMCFKEYCRSVRKIEKG